MEDLKKNEEIKKREDLKNIPKLSPTKLTLKDTANIKEIIKKNNLEGILNNFDPKQIIKSQILRTRNDSFIVSTVLKPHPEINKKFILLFSSGGIFLKEGTHYLNKKGIRERKPTKLEQEEVINLLQNREKIKRRDLIPKLSPTKLTLKESKFVEEMMEENNLEDVLNNIDPKQIIKSQILQTSNNNLIVNIELKPHPGINKKLILLFSSRGIFLKEGTHYLNKKGIREIEPTKLEQEEVIKLLQK